MLYLHGGWPKTGTTTLQNAFFVHRDALAAEGFVYPDRWMRGENPTHNGLSDLMDASRESPDALDELRAFLAANADKDILFSHEHFIMWLFAGDERDVLANLLATTQSVVPTRFVWTLRRFDEIARSLFFFRMRWRPPPQSPAEHAKSAQYIDDFFAGMRMVEESVSGQVAFARYDASGAHNEVLLDIFNVPDGAGRAIREQVRNGPRLNASLTHKAAVVLTNLDVVSSRAGVPLDERALRELFRSGGFRFRDEGSFELLDVETRRDLHEQALAAASRHGIASYCEFFGADEIRESPHPVGLDPDIITNEDLEQLVERLQLQPEASTR